jgi:hypothetical protein
VLFPSVTFILLYAWPWLDKRFTKDRAAHNVLDRPRDRPGRSAFGLGVLTFYAILLLAGSQDILASELNVTMTPVTWMLRIGVIVVPIIVGIVSFKLLRDLHQSFEQPEEVDEPEAPNEVAPELAPSPVGPARSLLPEYLKPPDADGQRPEAEPRRPRAPARFVAETVALVVSVIVELLAALSRRRKSRRKESPAKESRREIVTKR